MSNGKTLEKRFREGRGERYLSSDPNRVRCQGCSKTKLRALRVKYADPTLSSDDLWPEAQCTWAALEGAFGCTHHAGKSEEDAKFSMNDYMPADLAEKMQVFENNSAEILNRTKDIVVLKARNAQLFESLDQMVLGEEAWAAVAEARAKLEANEVAQAKLLLDIALHDQRSEKEVWNEIRTNTTIVDKLTATHFNVIEKLKIMMTVDQIKTMTEQFYRGAEHILGEVVVDLETRNKGMRMFAALIRDMTNMRQGALVNKVD